MYTAQVIQNCVLYTKMYTNTLFRVTSYLYGTPVCTVSIPMCVQAQTSVCTPVQWCLCTSAIMWTRTCAAGFTADLIKSPNQCLLVQAQLAEKYMVPCIVVALAAVQGSSRYRAVRKPMGFIWFHQCCCGYCRFSLDFLWFDGPRRRKLKHFNEQLERNSTN
jgi:hypothetical protein